MTIINIFTTMRPSNFIPPLNFNRSFPLDSIMLSSLLAINLNGNIPRRKCSNNVTWLIFSILLLCNGNFWREGDKGRKGIKERKKDSDE
jgi:hypothetical protein